MYIYQISEYISLHDFVLKVQKQNFSKINKNHLVAIPKYKPSHDNIKIHNVLQNVNIVNIHDKQNITDQTNGVQLKTNGWRLLNALLNTYKKSTAVIAHFKRQRAKQSSIWNNKCILHVWVINNFVSGYGEGEQAKGKSVCQIHFQSNANTHLLTIRKSAS